MTGDRGVQRARQRAGHLPLAGRSPGLGEVVGNRWHGQEQRDLSAGRVEHVLAGAVGYRDRRPRHDREARQPPQEYQQVGDREVTDRAAACPEVGGMEALVERGIREQRAVRGPQVGHSAGCPAGQQAGNALGPQQLSHVGCAGLREGGRADGRVEAVPGAAQAPEALHDVRGPPRDVQRQLLQDLDGALAAPVVDRLGDVQTLGPRVEFGDQVRGEKVAEIGDDPVVAGLDRLVSPHPVHAPPDDGYLLADPVEQFPQRAGAVEAVGVGGAVDRREQLPEPLGVVAVIAVVDVSHRRSLP